ncbi:NAD-dependent protein deacetylase sirtuin-7 [Aricia agestis]|uniref:NAD-dependent protein deacetylase sirtuin-7 n=1 Tax=Aricia agestis TaxID=91739 RepID=UPI001C205658|nr:NAD-dependent protein deacetylase sirtuin-7 [Aricia agestis]XP_041978206.1 NAD-dependent protein deacetylase sirtuin-7 [Aricia agestis]
MAAREGVRSSARLSGAATSSAPDAALRKEARLAAAERAAAAALRRQRAARAAERAREVEDSPRVLREKCRKLAQVLSEAKHLVVYTGAGISTAADIPDYRGPHGVWTRLQRGESIGRVDVSRARPTFTHMALTALWARGTLKFVVSQNCDGLHVRAGLPRRALAELHGDMFAERCAACRRVYLRAFDTTERTARHVHRTRRLCHACGTELRDTIVHFGERGRAAWPLNWAGALRHAAAADVVLCLGSSLKVLRRYPRLWRMHSAPHARPALYIVNLQWTPKDSVAALKINARCDAVMAAVARRLRLRVPRYRPAADPLLAHAEPLHPAEAHTTRRAPPPPPPADTDDDTSYYSLSSPSATDSDDELPLRRLADRLRPPSPPPPAPPPTPPPCPLRSFQIDMKTGSATILLRAEHAPAEPPPPEPPPPVSAAAPDTGALRRFRMFRPERPADPPRLNGFVTNGHDRPRSPKRENGPAESASSFKTDADIKDELGPVKMKKEDDDERLRPLLEWESRLLPAAKPDADCDADSAALAAAIIRRAVLVCRAQLYPGLHTILAGAGGGGAAAAGAAGEGSGCAWCARRFAARRCLWYGAPRAPPPERRVRRRGRLCACCDAERAPPSPPAAAPPTAGWYGKGYRKGRRRR